MLCEVWTKRWVGHGVGHGLPSGLPYGLPVVRFFKTSVGVEQVAGIKLLTHFSMSEGMKLYANLTALGLKTSYFSLSSMSSPAKQSIITAGYEGGEGPILRGR